MEESGGSLDHICRIVVYLTDIRYREAVYREMGKWLKGRVSVLDWACHLCPCAARMDCGRLKQPPSFLTSPSSRPRERREGSAKRRVRGHPACTGGTPWTVVPNPFSQDFTRSRVRRLRTPTQFPPRSTLRPKSTRLEAERIFATDWLCPGLADDIPNPGDYITYAINDQPIFVIRGKDGMIRSFSNVCLHRMMKLLDSNGNCGRITCPYHGWTYDTEGRVIGAGHMGKRDPEFDKKGYRLPELKTEIWHGWIYVTLNKGRAAGREASGRTGAACRALRACRLRLRRPPGSRLEDELEAPHRKLHGRLSSSRRA